ncbi:MAG: LysR family transcriptional regulator [Planctomycetes bacterium]|nr:LysR family transcriptional regulator [Planctomycetota bacterium]
MDVPDRFRELLPLWAWLPPFRAVAETEHLPTAAERCGVGASSLSRTIALLERAVGRPLFERTGRSLELNHDGRRLLEAVRGAMRFVDDACAEVRDPSLRGPLRIASSGAVTTAVVAPAVLRLREEHPGVEPQLLTRPADRTANLLLRGQLDIAFQESPLQARGLTVAQVGELTRAVYCGRRHPLFGVAPRRVRAARIEAAEFVAPPTEPGGFTPDGWPVERPRRVALTCDQLRVGLELCLEQPLLAVLPDALAETRPDELRRLDAVPIAPSPVYAAHRERLGARLPAAARLVELVQTRPAN